MCSDNVEHVGMAMFTACMGVCLVGIMVAIWQLMFSDSPAKRDADLWRDSLTACVAELRAAKEASP